MSIRRTLAAIALIFAIATGSAIALAPAASAAPAASTTADDGSTVSSGFYGDLGEGLVRNADGSLSWAPGYGPNGQKPGYVQVEDGSWVPASFTGRCYYLDFSQSVPQSYWDALLAQGWKGHAGDGIERVYSPGC